MSSKRRHNARQRRRRTFRLTLRPGDRLIVTVRGGRDD